MVRDINHVFIDPNIARKGEALEEHLALTRQDQTSPPLFSLMEFNLSGLCNRKCVFCPRVDPKVFPNLNEHIPVELYQKVVSELGELDYDGIILFSAFSEPLLYKQIEVLIKMTREFCPRVRIESVTNGDFVTPEKLRSLFHAGLDTLLISLYDGPEQLPLFEAMIGEVGLTDSQVVLRKRWLPPEQHYGITLSNRAGMVEIPEVSIGKIQSPLQRRCFYPFYQTLVDYDGSVLLCPHDWGKGLVAGNVNHQTVQEIWNGPVIRRARLSLARADRNFLPCSQCDVDGTLMGEHHFEQWMAYYDERSKSRSESS